jgi:DNA-binding transcriptional LysR family regulator
MRFARKELALPKGAKPRIVADDILFLREVLRAGVGVGMLPAYLGDPAVRRGELVRVLPSFRQRATGRLVILYPSGRRAPRKVTAFRDYLSQMLGSNVGA